MSENSEYRILPTGFDDEGSPYFILKPLRGYYQAVPHTVTDQPRSDYSKHLSALEEACDRIERALSRKSGLL